MTLGVRRWLVVAGLLCTVLGLAGFLVAASGIVPIKASSGHWAITEWILQFGKRRSIATHTLGKELPDVDDPALVLKGAGHYENGCRPCHGSPELKRPRIAAAMTPRPPYLPPLIAERDPEELFYVVKHGIKFTGMPAWPSQGRDDEVRAMVAFLLELPKLEARAYRRLIDGDVPLDEAVPPLRDLPELPPIPQALVTGCARCHGAAGVGRGLGAFPKLAGQRRDYLLNALRAYADGSRESGIMGPIAAALAADERRALAVYYARLTPRATASTVPGSAPAQNQPSLERGKHIAERGILNQGVPACADCHGPGPHRRNTAYPNLAGQYVDYLVLQLELFQRDSRGGSAYAHIMRHVATRLKPDQMHDVAGYYASLSSEGDRQEP